ncbi:hypothetical protein Tdes44962_MAKER08258 [Teratosphaeria destructans]|uniref:Uncharacterized protein n=1 Tax=Teratosphaeria destructans TaxID=418781 RepID=A0A9W7SX41_9PEZI|nr:hypothetical protein Tdes44962_MAKER08258 [Teratosphaeria destructans]
MSKGKYIPGQGRYILPDVATQPGMSSNTYIPGQGRYILPDEGISSSLPGDLRRGFYAAQAQAQHREEQRQFVEQVQRKAEERRREEAQRTESLKQRIADRKREQARQKEEQTRKEKRRRVNIWAQQAQRMREEHAREDGRGRQGEKQQLAEDAESRVAKWRQQVEAPQNPLDRFFSRSSRSSSPFNGDKVGRRSIGSTPTLDHERDPVLLARSEALPSLNGSAHTEQREYRPVTVGTSINAHSSDNPTNDNPTDPSTTIQLPSWTPSAVSRFLRNLLLALLSPFALAFGIRYFSRLDLTVRQGVMNLKQAIDEVGGWVVGVWIWMQMIVGGLGGLQRREWLVAVIEKGSELLLQGELLRWIEAFWAALGFT